MKCGCPRWSPALVPESRNMSRWLGLICIVVSVGATVFAGGCDTADSRQEVSRHVKALVAKIKARPNSDEGKTALKELLEILNGKWRFARYQVCYAIRDGDLGALATDAIPDLIRAAHDEDPFVEEAAIQALGSLGPVAAPAVKVLIGKVEIGVTGKSKGSAPWYAARALGDIGEPAVAAIPILRQASEARVEFLPEEAKKALLKLEQFENKQHIN